jgi:NADH-quinone oxidoreductase subunit M
LKDLNLREILCFAPIVVMCFWIGLYPKPFFDILEKPVAQIVERVRPGYYARKGQVSPVPPEAQPPAVTPADVVR